MLRATGAARCASAVHTQGVSADISSARKGYRPDTPKWPGENTDVCVTCYKSQVSAVAETLFLTDTSLGVRSRGDSLSLTDTSLGVRSRGDSLPHRYLPRCPQSRRLSLPYRYLPRCLQLLRLSLYSFLMHTTLIY